MSNRASLYNLTELNHDPQDYLQKKGKAGFDVVQVAEASYKLLIPWLLCFRQDDLKPVQLRLDEFDDEEEDEDAEPIMLGLPCTTVGKALERLRASLPVFEQLSGDSHIARMYWQHACNVLEALPLPYLALDPLEVACMSDPEPYIESMACAMAGDASAIAHLVDLSCFVTEAKPYSPDVLFCVDAAQGDPLHIKSSIAMDMGAVLSVKACQAAAIRAGKQATDLTKLDWTGGFAGAQTRLSNLLNPDPRNKSIQDPDHVSVFVKLMPTVRGKPQAIQVNIYASSAEALNRIKQNAKQQELMAKLSDKDFAAVCADQGFGWAGFTYSHAQ